MPREQINFVVRQASEPLPDAVAAQVEQDLARYWDTGIPVLRDGMEEIAGVDVPDAEISETLEPRVHVGWERGKHVQVGLEVDPVWAAVVLAGAGEGTQSVSLWTDSLDREEVNRLIRVLRRARDSAYGRDE